jgi:hypothetical protein
VGWLLDGLGSPGGLRDRCPCVIAVLPARGEHVVRRDGVAVKREGGPVIHGGRDIRESWEEQQTDRYAGISTIYVLPRKDKRNKYFE